MKLFFRFEDLLYIFDFHRSLNKYWTYNYFIYCNSRNCPWYSLPTHVWSSTLSGVIRSLWRRHFTTIQEGNESAAEYVKISFISTIFCVRPPQFIFQMHGWMGFEIQCGGGKINEKQSPYHPQIQVYIWLESTHEKINPGFNELLKHIISSLWLAKTQD